MYLAIAGLLLVFGGFSLLQTWTAFLPTGVAWLVSFFPWPVCVFAALLATREGWRYRAMSTAAGVNASE